MNQNAFDEYVISLRRKFHQHPELSGKEKDTRAVICAELEKLGIPYDIVDAKNVIGCIKNGSGKRIPRGYRCTPSRGAGGCALEKQHHRRYARLRT